MASADHETRIEGLRDPQRPIAVGVSVLLIVVGVVGLTGVLDIDIGAGLGTGLVAGLFGVPLWLGVTAIVAGLIGLLLSAFAGASTTFDKVAAGLVLPAVFLLAIADWGLAIGSLPTLALGVVAVLLAVALVVVGGILFYPHPLAYVLPVVAVLTIADWAVGLTGMAPASEPVNLPTLGLLVVLELLVGVLAFERGRRITRYE